MFLHALVITLVVPYLPWPKLVIPAAETFAPIFEAAFLFFFWHRRERWPWVYGLALAMNITSFFVGEVIYYFWPQMIWG